MSLRFPQVQQCSILERTHPLRDVLLVIQVQDHKLLGIGLQPSVHLLEGIYKGALLQDWD